MNEVNSLPIINVIVVISLFDIFVSLQSMGPNSLMFIRNLLDKLGSNQQNILKFIACNEIFLMPATVFMLFRYNLFASIFSCPVGQNSHFKPEWEHIVLQFCFLQLCYEFHTCIFLLQWPRKLAAAVYLLQIPDPALHIQKKSLLPVKF